LFRKNDGVDEATIQKMLDSINIPTPQAVDLSQVESKLKELAEYKNPLSFFISN